MVRLGVVAVIAAVAALAAPGTAQAGTWAFNGDFVSLEECQNAGLGGIYSGEWTDWRCQGPIRSFYFLYVDYPNGIPE